MTNITKKNSTNGGALEGLTKMVIEFSKFGLLMSWYFINGIKEHKKGFVKDIPIFLMTFVTSIILSKVDFFIDWWPHWIPEVFENTLYWYQGAVGSHLYGMTFFFIYMFLRYAVLGKIEVDRVKRIKEAVKILSKSTQNQYPKVISIKKINEFKTKVVVESPIVGVEAFKKEQDNLESSFNQQIESITRGISPRYVQIILNTKKLPNKYSYSEVKDECERPCHFILGESNNGLLTQDIRKLPHMLIAGTTNFGKSNFFKQVLLKLLQNTDHIQMHLIDLKGGLEMRVFKDLPNVNFVSDIDKALSTLKRIKREMDSRFEYLYKIGQSNLVPKRDKKDRIILAIDEASVLYMKKYGKSEESLKVLEARKITDDLAKLARAAGINLIIATQKVTKETLDTHIRENISGRVSFKANDNGASLTALGNTMATDLPAIPGRAIFNFGNEFKEFQAPLIRDKEIEQSVSELKKEHVEGLRSVFQSNLVANTKIIEDAVVEIE